jgi:hypothetical protein
MYVVDNNERQKAEAHVIFLTFHITRKEEKCATMGARFCKLKNCMTGVGLVYKFWPWCM